MLLIVWGVLQHIKIYEIVREVLLIYAKKKNRVYNISNLIGVACLALCKTNHTHTKKVCENT